MKWNVKYIAAFVLIQLLSSVLMTVGLFLIAILAGLKLWHSDPSGAFPVFRGYPWTLPWSNDFDGIVRPGFKMTRWNVYKWTALRNPCNNLRLWFSVPFGPLWLKNWTLMGQVYYAKAGWQGSTGQPVFSAGKGKW